MKYSPCKKSAPGTRISRLCMYIIGISAFLACTKHPIPGPGPAKVNDAPTANVDATRGRNTSLNDLGFGKTRVTAIEYSPVYFALNGTTPLPSSRETLEAMVEEMPEYTVCTVTGHTCPLGESAYNDGLGYRRANAVVDYLRAAGVRTGFEVVSYGEDRLASHNPARYRLNRRVVVECSK